MRRIVVVLFVIISPLFTASANADVLIFEKEYTYQASEFDSKASSRILALEQIKKLLLEQLGTFLFSETEVKSYQISKDQITTFTAGIVRTEVIDEKWDGKTYYLKAKLSADPSEVAQAVLRVSQEKRIAKELEETKKHADDLEKEIARLRFELTTKSDSTKVNQYSATVNKLSSMEWLFNVWALLKDGKDAAQNQEALKVLDKALELNAEDPDLYFERARIYYLYLDSKDYEAILTDIDKSIALLESEKSPASYFYIKRKTASRHIMKSQVYKYMGNWQQAVNEIELAINVDLEEAEIKIGALPAFYKPRLDPKRWSEKDFDTIIRKYPHDYRGYVFRALLYAGDPSILWAHPDYYQKVFNDYRKAIAINPNIALSHYLLGVVYSRKSTCSSSQSERLSYTKKAVEQFSKAIKLNPSYIDAYRRRKECYWDLGEYDKAINDLNKVLEIDPELQGVWFDLGLIYKELRQFDNAARAFTGAISAKKPEPNTLDSDNFEARAEVYLLLQKYKEAIDDCTKAIELRVAHVRSYGDWADRVFSRGDLKATQLYSLRGRSYIALGWSVFYGESNMEILPKDIPEFLKAIDDFTRAIKSHSESGPYKDRAEAYAAIGDYQHAIQDIDRTLRQSEQYKLNPVEIYIKRAEIYRDLGNLNQSISDYSTALNYADELHMAQVYCERSRVYLSLARFPEVIQDITNALKLSVNITNDLKTDLFINRGIAYINIGNDQAAFADYDKAIALSPSSGDAYYCRGRAHFSRYNDTEGINDFKIAARLGHKAAQNQLRKWKIDW